MKLIKFSATRTPLSKHNSLNEDQTPPYGMSVKVLEQTAAVRLLLLLARKGKMSMIEIRNSLEASNVAIYNAIKKLREAGLIDDKHEDRFPYRRLVELTPLGREVAELLARIEELLAEKGGEGS